MIRSESIPIRIMTIFRSKSGVFIGKEFSSGGNVFLWVYFERFLYKFLAKGDVFSTFIILFSTSGNLFSTFSLLFLTSIDVFSTSQSSSTISVKTLNKKPLTSRDFLLSIYFFLSKFHHTRTHRTFLFIRSRFTGFPSLPRNAMFICT